MTVRGYWQGITTYDPPDTISIAYLTRNWSVGVGQTLEWRVDPVEMSQHATSTVTELVNCTLGTYVFTEGRGYVRLTKYIFGSGPAHFFHENVCLPDTNIVLALALTRVSPNLIPQLLT